MLTEQPRKASQPESAAAGALGRHLRQDCKFSISNIVMNNIESLFSLDGQTAFISGASSGIGLHVAGLMARAGATVVLAARRLDRIEAEVQRLRAEGHSASCVTLDVASPESITQAWASAEEQVGKPIGILFNNAGIIYTERFLDQRLEEVERIFDVNLKGAFLLAQVAARSMVAQRAGSIINVSSTSGLRAGGYMTSYGASKAALLSLTQTMALELAGKGVRVNALCPGNFRTDMHAEFQERGLEESLIKRIPMHAIGEVDQIDGATLLLASRAGSYMTGSTVVVDGGQVLSWM
ncbi:SDR family NAD(P)-dependent oxidoreductase [Paraburkholderia sediminicola]|uniref:SDR family NAD(P)-dependent oxidoreductase n=1 Tax=Paraburkholderia sediminicola TaxID=458836 RepID=UPI0038B9DC70